MGDKLISLQAVLDAVDDVSDDYDHWRLPNDNNWYGELRKRIFALKHMPQRGKGEWIRDGHHIRCSYCDCGMSDTDREGDPITRNFCPACGSEMKGEGCYQAWDEQ